MILPSLKDAKETARISAGPVKMNMAMRKRDGLLFVGDVVAISSENEVGPFDILPYHENFISIIKRYVIVHLDNGLKKEFEIQKGVLKVEGNKVEIFIGW